MVKWVLMLCQRLQPQPWNFQALDNIDAMLLGRSDIDWHTFLVLILSCKVMESIRLNCLYFSTSMFQIDPQPHSQQHQYLFIPYIVGPDETLCLWLSQPVSAPKTINFYHVFVYLLSFPEIYFRITREFMFILRYFSNLKFNALLTITRFFCVLELVQDYS